MKALIRLLKPMILKLVIAQLKEREDALVSLALKKMQALKLPLSGEQEEQLITVVYDAAEEIIIQKIRTL